MVVFSCSSCDVVGHAYFLKVDQPSIGRRYDPGQAPWTVHDHIFEQFAMFKPDKYWQ